MIKDGMCQVSRQEEIREPSRKAFFIETFHENHSIPEYLGELGAAMACRISETNLFREIYFYSLGKVKDKVIS